MIIVIIIFLLSLKGFFTDIENIQSLPHLLNLTDRPNTYAVENQLKLLDCDIISTCKRCSAEIKWLKDDITINQNDSRYITSNKSLTIKIFTSENSGVYQCVYIEHDEKKSIDYIFSGLPVNVTTLNLPVFLAEDYDVTENQNQIIKCFKSDQSQHFKSITIQWYKDGKEIIGDEHYKVIGNLLVILNVTSPKDEGVYTCTSTYDGFIKESKEKSLHVQKGANLVLPQIFHFMEKYEILPSSRRLSILCIGNTKTLSMRLSKVSLETKLEHMLTQDTGLIHYEVNNTSGGDSGEYVCLAQNNFVMKRSVIRVDIKEKLKFVSTLQENIKNVYSSSNFSLDCQPNINSTTITWYHNGQQIFNTKSYLNLLNIQESDIGYYQCIIRNKYERKSRFWKLQLLDWGMKPANLSAQVLSANQVNVTWHQPLSKTNLSIYFTIAYISPDNNFLSFNTTRREFAATTFIYSGVTYNFKVCTRSDQIVLLNACSIINSTIFVEKLSNPMVIKSVETKNKIVIISWLVYNRSNGFVDYYKLSFRHIYYNFIYYHNDYYEQNITSVLTTKIKLRLHYYGFYEVSIKAYNKKGASPISEKIYFEAKNDEDNVLVNLQAYWVDLHNSTSLQIKWEHSALYRSIGDIAGYMLYCTQLPYIAFWQATKSYRINKTETEIKLFNLATDLNYRISLVPILFEIQSKSHSIKILKENNYKFITVNKKMKVNTTSQSMPKYIKCFPLEYHKMLLLWKPISSNNESYVVSFLHETDKYITHNTVHVNELEYTLPLKSYELWTHVSVVRESRHNQKQNGGDEKQYISCPPRVDVPTAVQDLNYTAIHDRQKDLMYIILSWKQPKYTGGCLFSYQIKHAGYTRQISGNAIFSFHSTNISLLINTEQKYLQANGYIYTKPIRVNENLQHKLEVIPINCMGRGVSNYIYTTVIGPPFEHERKEQLQELNSKSSAESTSITTDVTLGVICGVAASMFFLIVLIFVSVIYEPELYPQINICLLARNRRDRDRYNEVIPCVNGVIKNHEESVETETKESLNGIDSKYKPFSRLKRLVCSAKDGSNSSPRHGNVLYSSSSSLKRNERKCSLPEEKKDLERVAICFCGAESLDHQNCSSDAW